MVSTLFINNGYPKRFVKATIRQTENNTTCNQDNENVLYLKIPFVNEDLKRRALSVIRRSGIDNVRITFVNGKPSSRVFAPRKERLECPQSCQTCKSAKRSNRCQIKNVVYEITCQQCGTVYVGETSRTVGSRSKFHLSFNKFITRHGMYIFIIYIYIYI